MDPTAKLTHITWFMVLFFLLGLWGINLELLSGYATQFAMENDP